MICSVIKCCNNPFIRVRKQMKKLITIQQEHLLSCKSEGRDLAKEVRGRAPSSSRWLFIEAFEVRRMFTGEALLLDEP